MGEIQNNNRAISTSDAPVKLETARMRRSDNGSATLAHMENFVRLTRRIKRTALLDQLVAYANATAVMAASSTVDTWAPRGRSPNSMRTATSCSKHA